MIPNLNDLIVSATLHNEHSKYFEVKKCDTCNSEYCGTTCCIDCLSSSYYCDLDNMSKKSHIV